jgi:flagellar export protein FliJ
MTVFRFRLQALLDKRIEERNLAEVKLTEAKRAHRTAQQKLSDMEKLEQKLAEQIASTREQLLIASQASSVQLGRLAIYLRGLEQDERSARHSADFERQTVEKAEEQVRKAHTWLAECSREMEILDKYREKLRKSFLRAALRKEEIEQDEISALLHPKRGDDV